MAEPLLEVRGLEVAYGSSTVVHGVDFEIPTRPFGLALVGESGSGKTTIARALLRLHPAKAGSIKLGESDLLGVGGAELKRIRRSLQVAFQDSDAALDPRLRVGRSVAEALRTHHVVGRSGEEARVETLLEEVGLDGELARRYPHQLSGGQRQRVGIARALATEPELMILDEPTSALDVTVQATILRLFARLREERSLAYLLISHNLAVVDQLCERIVVLYRGRVVERGETRTILRRPAHPYTQALRRAVPELGVDAPTRLSSASGPAPSSGCPYAHRCPLVIDRCREARPQLVRASDGSEAACIRIEEALAGWDAGDM